MRRIAYRRFPWLRAWRRKFFSAVLILALVPQAIDAANGFVKGDDGCTVWRVIDGDTLSIRCGTEFDRLRLVQIDTPELNAGCWGEFWRAWAAKQRLRWALLSAKQVTLPASDERDRFDRLLGQVLVDGTSVGHLLVDARLAVPYIPGDITWCDRIERGEI